MIKKSFLDELFKAFYIQRWNDKIRPVELIEMDKHAHKMFITYCIGRYEEDNGRNVNWHNIIKGGIYELLRRIVISDIKSPIFYKIKQENKETFRKLNDWVYKKLEPIMHDDSIKAELKEYLINDKYLDTLSQRILDAAHKYASFWEFKIIKYANPDGYQIQTIERDLYRQLGQYMDFVGIRKLMSREPISEFLDLCAQLRFQIRWSQTPRMPKTSVLGHSLFVACLSYFFTRANNGCSKRLYNAFYCGLFHDLPEAVTRDIISPVKESSKEFQDLVKKIEQDLAEEEIYPLVESSWIKEIKYYTQNEFANKAFVDEKLVFPDSVEDINRKFNEDIYNVLDGEIIRTADHLAGFLEAWHSVNFGLKSEEISKAMKKISNSSINKRVGSVNIGELYQEFIKDK